MAASTLRWLPAPFKQARRVFCQQTRRHGGPVAESFTRARTRMTRTHVRDAGLRFSWWASSPGNCCQARLVRGPRTRSPRRPPAAARRAWRALLPADPPADAAAVTTSAAPRAGHLGYRRCRSRGLVDNAATNRGGEHLRASPKADSDTGENCESDIPHGCLPWSRRPAKLDDASRVVLRPITTLASRPLPRPRRDRVGVPGATWLTVRFFGQ